MLPGIKTSLGMFGSKTVSIAIVASTDNVNLFTLAGAPTAPSEVIFTVNSGVLVGSTTTATAAIVTGTFPAGSKVRLINNGTIDGRGGAGGAGRSAGSNGPGSPGGAGGDAISCSFNLEVTNNGLIRGGGGGGGGGGASDGSQNGDSGTQNGGTGGNGAGSQGPATTGQAGIPTQQDGYILYSGNGGNGGPHGSAGGAGGSVSDSIVGASPYASTGGSAGGAAGRAMRLNGTASSITGGTIAGAIS